MKKFYKSFLALALFLGLMTLNVTCVRGANVSSLSVTASGNKISVNGSCDSDVSACAVTVYDSTGGTLLDLETCAASTGKYSYTLSKDFVDGTYLIKVADYNGGAFESANITVDTSTSDTADSTVAVTGVKLDKSTVTLNPKKTAQLAATIEPANATNQAVKWSTSNKSVATVDGNGKVTAKAAGTAKITVTTVDGGKTATCTIKVRGITLNDTKVTVQKGKTNKSVTAKAVNDTLDKVTVKDKKIATVKLKNGKLQIKGVKKGKTTVTVKSKGGISQTVTVTVQTGKVTTTKLTVKKTKVSIKKNKSTTVQATATPDKVSTGEKIKVSSNNKKIATASVDGNGKITIKGKKKGKCKVTVTAGKKTKKITVTVK